MSNKKLDALKALFKKEKDKKDNNGKSFKRGDFYPFWQMNEDEKAIVRILPDANTENPYIFYTDKLEHKLAINGKDETIPCLTMYNEKCPICELSKDFYKAEGKETVSGKYYYRKKTSLVRLLVIEDPLPPDEETKETCAGKVCNSQFSYQLMEKIKEEISTDELDGEPWDLKEGYNFIIKKTAQGKFGTYTVGSGFARKQSAIPKDLVDSIELIDLSTLLPKNPGYELVKRKLDAHLNGSDDTEGEEHEEEDEDAIALRKLEASLPKVSKLEEKVVEDSDEEEDDIIAQIRRNRKK